MVTVPYLLLLAGSRSTGKLGPLVPAVEQVVLLFTFSSLRVLQLETFSAFP